MSENLFKAVYTLYSTDNTFKTATAGRFAYGVAPEAWADNFALIQGTDLQKDDCFRQAIDDAYFQINVFSTTRHECFDLLDKCVTLFDNATISITGHYASRISRETRILPVWNEQINLYQATAEFTAKLQKT